MSITVKIDQYDSNLVERKFFEHAAGRDNIAFLMRDEQVNWNVLQNYIDIVETRFYELEKCKKYLSEKYLPMELKDKAYDFAFDFDNETLIYAERAD